MTAEALVLAAAFLLAAILYSSVGHAGASGYLAAMAFVGTPTPMMRPTALVRNLIVASIAAVRLPVPDSFRGRYSGRLLGSVPLAYVGGAVTLPGHWYRTLVGLVLWAAALRLWLDLKIGTKHAPPRLAAILCGAGIGLLAGLTGTGGGIFPRRARRLRAWKPTDRYADVSTPSRRCTCNCWR